MVHVLNFQIGSVGVPGLFPKKPFELVSNKVSLKAPEKNTVPKARGSKRHLSNGSVDFYEPCTQKKSNKNHGFKMQLPPVEFSWIWVFPKMVRFPSKSSILIGFSIIFTIHFGVPLFLETPICLLMKSCGEIFWGASKVCFVHLQLGSRQKLIHTVDGSEVPFPTTVWTFKDPVNIRRKYQPQTGERRISESSTVPSTGQTGHQLIHIVLLVTSWCRSYPSWFMRSYPSWFMTFTTQLYFRMMKLNYVCNWILRHKPFLPLNQTYRKFW